MQPRKFSKNLSAGRLQKKGIAVAGGAVRNVLCGIPA